MRWLSICLRMYRLNATANLNLSMEGLECKISSSIRNMLTDEVQAVAFLEGMVNWKRLMSMI